MRVRFYVSIFVIIAVQEINGFPSRTLEKEPLRSTNILARNHPFLRGSLNTNRKTQAKLTFKRADILAACNGEKGPKRKTCVTSFVRRTYPEYFKKKQKDQTTKTSVEVTQTPNPACQNIDQTTTATVKLSNSQPKKNLPALLVAPGEPKKIAEITQQEQLADTSNLQTNTLIPVDCRAGKQWFMF